MSITYGDLGLQYIAGDWRAGASGRELISSDPYDGEDLITLQMATIDDVDAAYVGAEQAQPAWAALPPSDRTEVMQRVVAIFDKRHDEIVDWLIRESGSTRIKAEIEWGLARNVTEESATFPGRLEGRILTSDIPDKVSRAYRKPVGVVAVISPWNFPLHLSQRSVAPALALGNSVVLKPASDTPVTGGLLIAKIFEEAGLPAGTLSVVVGAGSEIGDSFVEHPTPSVISFTGSTPVGRGIGRTASGGEHLKRVTLELGGNAPFVVLADADLDNAVNAAIFGAFLHQGQICMAINQIIVEAPIHQAFLDKFVARVEDLKFGDPSAADTAIGPIINSSQLDALKEKIDLATSEGARVVVGGSTVGNVMSPHVFADVRPEMEIARDEIFGPLVGVLSARDEAHALELANSSDFGLAGAVHTSDTVRGVTFAQQVVAGMVHVNDQPVNDEPNAPFGGEKNSGLGRLNGDWAIETFTTDQWITVQHAPRHYPF